MNPRTITSAWLRDYQSPNGVLLFGADVAAMLADALDIADAAAKICIQSYAPIEQWEPPRQYDLARVEDRDANGLINQAVRYLDARGMLKRDQVRPELVRVVSEAKAEAAAEAATVNAAGAGPR